jgi:hypothetical protein
MSEGVRRIILMGLAEAAHAEAEREYDGTTKNLDVLRGGQNKEHIRSF